VNEADLTEAVQKLGTFTDEKGKEKGKSGRSGRLARFHRSA
jgi:hypothetical protein